MRVGIGIKRERERFFCVQNPPLFSGDVYSVPFHFNKSPSCPFALFNSLFLFFLFIGKYLFLAVAQNGVKSIM